MNRPRYPLAALACAAGYVASIVLANWLSNRYGLITAGFGLLVSAGTYSAAVALCLRDWLHELAGPPAVLVAIVIGAGVSYGVSSAAIATASAVAFTCSELADMAIYTPLRERQRSGAVAASNAVGAVIDTLLFLWIAGFPLTGQSIGGQLLVKAVWVTGGFLVLDYTTRTVIRRRRPVLA